MKKIYVDADACPVKDEITKVAIRHNITVFMVCNCLLYTSPSPRD